jgi:multidrug resistance efflux pump
MLEALWEAAAAKEQEVLRGPRKEEIEQAFQLLQSAKAEEETAWKQYERTKKLKEGDLSPSELEEFELRATAARKTRLAREAQWTLLTTGASEEEKEQAKAAVKSALGRLKQAQAELKRLQAGASSEEKQVAEALYLQADAAVERARILLGNTKIASPIDGVVLRRFHHPGELVHPQIPLPLLVLCDDADRELRIEVMEGDVYKIQPGQKVSIKSESYIGRHWEGKVSRLAPVMGRKRLMSEHPREKTDVKVLEAWVLPDERLDLPINVPVEVTTEIVLRHDVPVVPWRCVALPEQTVRLADGSVRRVELGERDDGFVEIVSGVRVGDRILLPDR